MKSPNVLSTSSSVASFASGRSYRMLVATFALALCCPALFCSCKTTESESVKKSPANNPYAKWDPKTPEEEAYYRDVYSGNWGEDDYGGAPTIGKSGGSLKLPEHWHAMPPGAKTLEEIRYEASQRRMAETRAANPYPATAPVNPNYGGQAYPSAAQPATPPTPPASGSLNPYAAQPNPYANPNAAYANQQYATPNATPQLVAPGGSAQAPNVNQASPYAEQTYGQNQPNPYAAPQPAQDASYAAQLPSQNVQYVAQVPGDAPAQPNANGASQNVQSYPEQTQQPQQPVQQPAQNVYPTSAAFDFNKSVDAMIVRGQEPEEDDPFAESEEDPFADSEDEEDEEGDSNDDASEEVEVDLGAVESDSEEKPETQSEDAATETVVQPTRANVNERSVAPEALATASAPSELQTAVPAPTRIGGAPRPLVVDPSIAADYADVHRPTPNPSAPEKVDSFAPRSALDEYVLSGGDSKGAFFSNKDWSIENLDPEDSAAHFDTIDGRILSEPSNRVFIYSPRFGAIRQIVGAVEGSSRAAIEIANSTQEAAVGNALEGVDVREQETKALGAVGSQAAEGAESSTGFSIATGLERAMSGEAQIRLGAMLASTQIDELSVEDSELMLNGAIAAQGWSGEQGVAVAADLVNAFSNAYVEGAATIYHIKDDTKTSKLRVIKIANKDSARPGEFVEFALRFENIGDEPIGNVTILDNLSARLRYVEGTAQSSMQADFLADLSETGSLVLRWEIEQPLQPKEFGVVRFICKVL